MTGSPGYEALFDEIAAASDAREVALFASQAAALELLLEQDALPPARLTGSIGERATNESEASGRVS